MELSAQSIFPVLTSFSLEPVKIVVCSFCTIGGLIFSTIMPLFIFGMIVVAAAQAPQTAYSQLAKIVSIIVGVAIGDGVLAYLSWSGFKNNCLQQEIIPPSSLE